MTNTAVYVGNIGEKVTVEVTLKSRYFWDDDFYCKRNYIYTFEDSQGHVLVWKTTTNIGKELETEDGEEWYGYKAGDILIIAGKVKDHSEYKGTAQTVLTRCKVEMSEKSLTKEQRDEIKREEQLATLKDGDQVREMPYKQYKEHYSDCETVVGTYKKEGPYRAMITIIIRAGREKPSGVRGQRFAGWEFKCKTTGQTMCFRAVSEENAAKQLARCGENPDEWEINHVYF